MKGMVGICLHPGKAIAVAYTVEEHADGSRTVWLGEHEPMNRLFEDDLAKRNRITCLFLRGLARLGLAGHAEAAADLRQVLAMDRNHLFARLELDHLNRDNIVSIA